MAAKTVKFGMEARQLIKDAIDILANCASVTMGPRGAGVLFRQPWGQPHITKDGITVAKNIELSDDLKNMAVQIVKSAAQKTCLMTGDGTTLSIVLAQAIYNEGFQLLTAGYSSIDLKRGIDRAVDIVIKNLDSISIPTQDKEKIAQIGSISANDESIGNLIADAMEKVGRDGIITLQESQKDATYLEIMDGMQLDRGALSSYFLSDSEKYETELKECLLLIHDGRLEDIQVLVPLLKAVSSSGKPLLIIAEDLSDPLLNTLIVNRIKGSIQCAAIKSPGFGDRRKEILKDIAALTGGRVLGNEHGLRLDQAELEHLGSAKKITVTKTSTTIIGGYGKKEDIQNRILQIKNDINHCDSAYDVEKMQDRMSKLTGGAGVIFVGGVTEIELKEKKDRVEDAIFATKAAVLEGIVAGGGVALLRCQDVVQELVDSISDRGEREGAKIILNVLEIPTKTIVKNAGGKPDVVIDTIMKSDNPNFGYNAATGQYEDLVESGIIDPKKVVRCAIQNAASVASMLITTEAMIVDEEVKKENKDG